MIRKSWAIAGLLLLLGLTSGCGFRDRPGLLSRFRARGAAPECNPYGTNGYEGSMVMPVSTPAGPCPCTTVPGGIVPVGGDIFTPNGIPQTGGLPGDGSAGDRLLLGLGIGLLVAGAFAAAVARKRAQSTMEM